MARQNRQVPKQSPPRVEPARRDLRRLAAAALLIIATMVVYAPSLHAGFNLLDDNTLLAQNPLVRAADGLYRFWFTAEAIDYWPVFNSALWIEWRLWGTNPFGYHVVSLVLHIADALLIWAILRRLRIPGAYLAALLFALHPVNVASVAWITQLKNLLALTFSLLSVLLYLPSPATPAGGDPPALEGRYAASFVAFALAMLSKSSVAVLPVFLLGITAWQRPLIRRDLVRVAPYVGLSLAFAIVTSLFRARFGAEVQAISVAQRLLEGAWSVWFYLYKALVPLHLSFIYPKWEVRADELQSWLPLVALVAVTGVLWRYRRRGGRGLLMLWVLYGAALAPALAMAAAGLMEKWSVADPYQHVALIPVVVLLGATWAAARQRDDRWRRLADGAALAVAGSFAILTWRQSSLYVDQIALYQASLRYSPDSAFAHNTLGLALLSAGRAEEAEQHFEQALRLRPDYLEVRGNLATALIALQRRPEAIEQLQQALRLKPDSVDLEVNLGGALLESGQRQQAIAHYEQALRLQPDHADAQFNLGRALYLEGRPREAIEHFRQALRVRADDGAAHNALGVALGATGERAAAIEQLREAVRLDPNDRAARDNLAELLGQ